MSGPPPGPVALACPGCGYDLTGVIRDICPECGRTIVEDDRSAAAARISLLVGAPRLFKRTVGAHLAAAVGLSVLAASLLRSREAGLKLLAAAGLCVFGGIAIGCLASLTLPAPQRAVHCAAWLKNFWMLNIPWLSILAFAAVPCISGLLAAGRGSHDGGTVVLPSLLSMFLWLALCIVALARWIDEWARQRKATAMTDSTLHRTITMSAAIVVCVASSFVGSGAASAVVNGVIDLGKLHG